MKKRILSIILTVTMIVCMIPLGMVTVYAGYYVYDTATLQSYGTNGGDVYIASSTTFNLTGGVTVAKGKKLIVDLHGGYLAPTGNFTSFIVNGTLVLKNSSADGACIDGVKKPSGSNTPLIEVRDGGTVYFDDNSSKGSVDLKNNYYDWGGAVIVRKGGNLVMGAKAQIYNCKANNGGGVLLESGTFTMNGGKIANCSVSDTGGGVYANAKTNGIQGIFIMNGGTIENCKATNGGPLIYMNGGVAKFKVNYNFNSGTGGTTSEAATYGSAMPAITFPTRSGYTFTGYYDGSGTKYYNANGTSAKNWDKVAAPVTLWAGWSQDRTLTYNANGHGTAPANVTMKYTAAINAAAELTADNCVFNGWNTKADGTGTAYAAGAQIKAANVDPTATTLYAQWHEHSFTGDYKVNDDGTHQQKCDGCDEYNEAVKHTFTNGVCVCGYKCTHNFGEWQNGDNVTYRVCETCGYAETESKDEKSDVNFDYNISAFGAVEKADDVEFKVEKKNSASTEAAALRNYVIKKANQTATVFDISAYVNKVKTQINDGYTVRVKVKIPDGYTNIKVFYIPDVVTSEADIEEIQNVEVIGEFACFNVTHFSDYAITGDLEGNLSYEYYLVEAPTLSENGLYNQRSYYINGSNEKVFVEDKLLGEDLSIDFAGWYLRTMVQYKMNNGNYDIRFISMLNGDNIDSEKSKLPDYDYAGFTVKLNEQELTPATTTEANTSFLANEKEISISDYSRSSDYFFLANIVFADGFVNNDSVITVVPFVKLIDGTTIEGKTVTFTIGQLTGN